MDIVSKLWNLINDARSNTTYRNTFVFGFKHDANVRRALDNRPWSIKVST